MRFISVRQMRQNSAELWKHLKDDREVVLTSNGKPVAVMAGVDEENVEQLIKALRRAKAALALEEMHQASIKTGSDKMTTEEINTEIKAVRKNRTR